MGGYTRWAWRSVGDTGEILIYLWMECGRSRPVVPLVLILVAVILSTHKSVLRTLPERGHGVRRL